MHQALASTSDDPAFAPEPFNAMAQRSVYQTMRASLRRAFAVLQKRLPQLPEQFRDEAKEVLSAEQEILAQEQRLLESPFGAHKIRIHGDYHLGQALYTGKDFVILDFEGEPARALSERKLKRSALRDVAGMMRSFQVRGLQRALATGHAQGGCSFPRTLGRSLVSADERRLPAELSACNRRVHLIPKNESDPQMMLQAYLLDKAVYEIGYELNHRPDWVLIPIRGIKHILRAVDGAVKNES